MCATSVADVRREREVTGGTFGISDVEGDGDGCGADGDAL